MRELLPVFIITMVLAGMSEYCSIRNDNGAYIKKDISVLKKAKDNKILDRVLETNISNEIYDELEKLIGE